MKNLYHYFLPHPQTHQKAHLLSWHFLVIYILLFILLQLSFNIVGFVKPGILGINSNISTQQIINETNKKRAEKGLPQLRENQNLSQAAYLKAQNMFEENYWAHFSPSGKDPWKFILSSGYKFSYAGENLAKNFYNSEDAVDAWMNSPSHRENILNPQYQDIGIAVVDGVLQGQKTTLVVQMFGRPYEAIASVPKVNAGGNELAIKNEEISQKQPMLIAGTQSKTNKIINQSIIDPFLSTRVVSICLISLIAFLLIADFVVLKRRGVFRLSSQHFAHLSLLAITSSTLFINKVGEII